ncbi:MAG: glycoside hydrolase family 28 protein [Bacteroidales bacterium]|nr:glycoside hydrolase family 28 protein [Bacteroidales bacterium]MCB9000272.1 glycoside hydrolase family 28 protein [Bacteroidales bacterium]MCB9012824.1 glycoside hydrolase family 28 protein [Bacteroidales bacterium]
MNRKIIFTSVAIIILVSLGAARMLRVNKPNYWKQAEEILKDIHEPEFGTRVFNISDYGAKNDSSLSTNAIHKAIAACVQSGGGTVLVPDGIFYTGAIHLESNVNLHLSDGAVLKFSTDPKDYLPLVKTRWEGIDCYNYSSLIYAADAVNVGVTGKGILDGQADESNWWTWKGRTEYGWKEGMPSQNIEGAREKLAMFEEKQVPLEERIMGEGCYLRPQFIVMYNCKNVILSDITIQRAPFWLIHPVFTENLIVRGVRADSQGPNNDGCDPESCNNVLIENCYFSTGDDCIAIKSGRNNDGRNSKKPSENIIIRNCNMENGHGGVVIGSEISGGCKNVFAENCTMNSPELERAIRIKTNSLRGGVIENLYFRNIDVGQVKEAVLKINCMYEIKNNETGDHIPLVRNIHFEGIKSKKSKYALFFIGVPGQNNISNIMIEDCSFLGVQKENSLQDVRKLSMQNVSINGEMVTATIH